MDLFSGIGGVSLGLESVGMRTAGFCEADEYCRRVLAKHWPDVPCHPDICTLRGDEFGPVDLISAGWPCQPVSCAGQRRGKDDDRYLWPEVARIVSTVRPAWFLGENVAGLITMGLDEVLSDLEGMGYACWTAVVPAAAVGAPHRRDRVVIVAHANGARLEVGRGIRRDDGEERTAAVGSDWTDVANTNGIGRHAWTREQGGEASSRIRQRHHLERRAWDAWPTTPPLLRRGDDGLSDRLDGIGRLSTDAKAQARGRQHRLRGLGNAFVPQLVAVFGEAIMDAHVRFTVNSC